MKPMKYALITAALLASATSAMAQFVKGNEAVKLTPSGQQRVETPPVQGALLAKPCPAAKPACSGAGWKMVETKDGLMECTEVYARPSTCKPSTYGSQKIPRVWVVKTSGTWQHCSHPELGRGCVSITKLPSPAVQ